MATSLLSTKLYIPQPPAGLVPRSRLMKRLDEDAAKRILLVSAPAGFGKTTILSAWIQERKLPAAWLSLDAEDNDPTQFLIYVVAALRAVNSDFGGTPLALLQATPPTPLQDVLVALINELAEIPDDSYLFLDDYHLIETEEVHTALAYLVEHLPQKIHITFSSRSDPPLPLSRLRARGQLAEMRQADLRFTPKEAASFLNQSMGLNLSPEQVGALEVRTEGWIAGLQLAALSMRGKDGRETFIQEFSGSHHFVIDYLTEEVLAQQPQELRLFLEQTAILDRLTASLCEALTGRDDCASLLRKLEETNLFLIPLDDRRKWYRYHQLFRDFIRYQLEEPDLALLHERACDWFMAEGFTAEAVKHALASGDLEKAVKAISQAAPEALRRGSLVNLRRWLDALPENTVLTSSELAVYKGFSLLLAQSYEEAIPYATAADSTISPEAAGPGRGRLLSLKANIALCQERLKECIRFSDEALDLLDQDDWLFRNLTYNALGQVLEMKGDIPAAADVYAQAFHSSWAAGDQMGSLVVFTNLIFALNETGKRREAVALCENLAARREFSTSKGSSLLDAVFLPWSLLSYEANELDVALDQVQRALTLLTAASFSRGIIWGWYILARIYLAKGEHGLLFQISSEGLRLASEMGLEAIHGAWFAALEAQVYLQQGNLVEVAHWAEIGGFSPGTTPHYWHEYPYFTYGRLLLAQQRSDEADELFAKMEESARTGGRRRKLITVHLLRGQLELSRGNLQKALARVKRAIRLAAPEGYCRAFLDEGQSIAPLLPQVREAAPAFVGELMAVIGGVARPVAETGEFLEPLTKRELEVLQLVAKGMSNRQIAERLFITLGTVKKHLNNIFGKLAVENRTQAVARARELGLLA